MSSADPGEVKINIGTKVSEKMSKAIKSSSKKFQIVRMIDWIGNSMNVKIHNGKIVSAEKIFVWKSSLMSAAVRSGAQGAFSVHFA